MEEEEEEEEGQREREIRRRHWRGKEWLRRGGSDTAVRMTSVIN